MPRPRLSAGDPLSTIHSASYHNQIADVLAIFEVDSQPLSAAEILLARNAVSFPVRNDTTEDTPRYAILATDGYLFDAMDDQDFKGRRMAFKGIKPKANRTDNVVIMLEPCEAGKIRDAIFLGWIQCKVDITDESHEYASPIDDDFNKLQSSGSGIQIIPKDTGTGEKWCAVKIGTGGGVGALFEAYAKADVDGTNFDVENINVLFGSYSDTETTGNAVINRPSWVIDQGGWVVVVVDASSGDLIAIQSECPTDSRNIMIWQGEWTA